MSTAELFKPYLGLWVSRPGGPGPASTMKCRRRLAPFGAYIRLEADWDGAYQEIAFFGAGEGGTLAVWSFTSDGGRSQGTLTDGSDVHPNAVAFESRMPAGMARFLYWPAEDGAFNFAVEAQTPAGWNRFMHHVYSAEA